jgi:hypothetical protein
MLYPEGIIHLQQDHASIHGSRVVQEWLQRQADVELLDWPTRTPDMNHIENMLSEVKRTMHETRPVLPPRNSYELWALVSTRYIRSLIESMKQRMKSVVEAERFLTSYKKSQFLKTALLKAKALIFIF